MTGEITTLDGTLVSKLEVGKNKGINTIEWGFNGIAPKVAKGKGFSVAPPPSVIAGKYLVKISKGNEVFEKQVKTGGLTGFKSGEVLSAATQVASGLTSAQAQLSSGISSAGATVAKATQLRLPKWRVRRIF